MSGDISDNQQIYFVTGNFWILKADIREITFRQYVVSSYEMASGVLFSSACS